MRKTRLPYVTVKAVNGKRRVYFRKTWTEDGKRRERFIPLPHDEGSEDFHREYWAIRSGTSEALKTPARETWRDLITSYKGSPKYRKLAPRTQRSYSDVMETILAKNADKPVRSLTRPKLREIHAVMHETPRKADMLVQMVSILFNFGRTQLDWRIDNPAEGMEMFGRQREYEAWPKWMLDAFQKAAADSPHALMAFHLGIGTGQRPGDLCAMEWAHYDGEYIAVVQDKQREAGPQERLSIYCPDSLRAFLNATPKRGRFMLARNLTAPLQYAAVEKQFRKVRDDLGEAAKPYSLHGLRKNASVALAEAGCSDAEIQAVTGHKSVKMVQGYRRAASQKSLSKQAQQRREQKGDKA